MTLEETDRLFTCEFCRVRLYITAKDHLRYFLPPSAPSSAEVIYVPYWRLRGLYFSVRGSEIGRKVLDTSFLAAGGEHLPESLGLRPQALRLRFAAPRRGVAFLRHDVPLGEALSRMEKISNVMDGLASSAPVYHRAFVGERVSMIYSPLYIKGDSLYDGIVNRPVAPLRGAERLRSLKGGGRWNTRFLPAVCPHCGWDLEGGRRSIVLLCRNCERAWQISGGRLKRTPFAVHPSRGGATTHIPFWRVRVEVEGLRLRSYADLIRTANLPRVVRREWEERELHFWVPAFMTVPDVFLRVARQVTISQPEGGSRDGLKGGSFAPVTIGQQDAFDSAKVVLAGLAVPRKRVFPMLPEISVTPREALLVYLPFKAERNEYVQTDMRFSIHRGAIR